MKHELLDRIPSRIGQTRKAPQKWMRDLFPGRSADEVADLLIRIAGEIEIAENRAW